jgi:hypothetical protein
VALVVDFTPVDAGTATTLVETGLTIGDTTVTCSATAFSAKTPVPKDIAYQALTADSRQQCNELIATTDPGWNYESCDDPPARESATTSSSGCACGLVFPGGDAPITTLAVLAALLCFRARRRARVN